MPTYTTQIPISRTPTQLWPLLAEVERWPSWLPTVTSVELLEGGFFVGGRYKVAQPKLAPAIWTLTEILPEKGFTWVSSSPGVQVTATHRLLSQPDQTRLELGITMTGPMAWLGGLLMGKLTQNYIEQEAAAFKKMAEER